MLETRGLTKKYSGVTALEDLSFTLEKGKIYALLGPNGSGKSSWMRLAAGIDTPNAGEILLDGKRIDASDRARISYMPTEAIFYSWMSVRDVGRYYRDFFSDFSEERFEALLGLMELEGRMSIKQLSTGMAAKLRIAAAMSRRAELYLLDEPLNGIDLIARDHIMEAVIGAMRDDAIMLLSSHLVEEMESFISQAIFLRNGRLLEICDAEKLREESGKSISERYRELYR